MSRLKTTSFLPYKIYNTIEEGFHTYYNSVILYDLFRSFIYGQTPKIFVQLNGVWLKVKEVVDIFYRFREFFLRPKEYEIYRKISFCKNLRQ